MNDTTTLADQLITALKGQGTQEQTNTAMKIVAAAANSEDPATRKSTAERMLDALMEPGNTADQINQAMTGDTKPTAQQKTAEEAIRNAFRGNIR